jgi:hypothetical protein
MSLNSKSNQALSRRLVAFVSCLALIEQFGHNRTTPQIENGGGIIHDGAGLFTRYNQLADYHRHRS